MRKRIINAILLCTLTGILLSCSEGDMGTGTRNNQVSGEDADGMNVRQVEENSPQQIFAEFEQMVKKVKGMSREEIQKLSDKQVLVLGAPLLKATENTVKYRPTVLEKFRESFSQFNSDIRRMDKEEHTKMDKIVDELLDREDQKGTRTLNTAQVREMVLNFSGGEVSLLSTCESMFNVPYDDMVLLYPGDNFNLANSVCPAGSVFYIMSGTHTGQSVSNSKTGNSWVGAGTNPIIMDGQNSVNRAFNGGMDENSISGFQIKNYVEYGVYSSGTEEVLIHQMAFKNISPNKNGQYYGAIRFDYAEDIEVSDSYFENVASSVRYSDSDGPLKVLDNEALNTGRNFFQCGRCSGSSIRINNNSIEHTSQYGIKQLEDFINIFESEGISNDYIQVNHNRARTNGTGSGVSVSGSFIILGDSGGKYQEARNNIGVNTGNVGIGAAGGEYIEVVNNKMYSDAILNLSNVAFYSGGNPPCNNHVISGNEAHWYCYRSVCGGIPNPVLNRSHAPSSTTHPDYCGVTISDIRSSSSVLENTNMDEDIWDEW